MAAFTNKATLSYNGTTVDSNTVTGNIVEVLEITKNAVYADYGANDDVTYIISITNSGATAFSGITVTDNLGAYAFGSSELVPLDYVNNSAAYYQNGVLQTAPTVTSVKPLIFSGISVPACGNAMIIYEAKTNSYAPLDAQGTITNTATLTATGITSPITAEETISASAKPELTITKSLNPVNVTENSEITYTFTIQNTGNTAADALDNIVITDVFTPALSNLSVTINGAAAAASAYTYSEATGEFETTAGVVTVPAATITQDSTTGIQTVTPGVTVLTVTGTI